jgi:hypothetical protein
VEGWLWEGLWERLWERIWERLWEGLWERLWETLWERLWKRLGNCVLVRYNLSCYNYLLQDLVTNKHKTVHITLRISA